MTHQQYKSLTGESVDGRQLSEEAYDWLLGNLADKGYQWHQFEFPLEVLLFKEQQARLHDNRFDGLLGDVGEFLGRPDYVDSPGVDSYRRMVQRDQGRIGMAVSGVLFYVWYRSLDRVAEDHRDLRSYAGQFLKRWRDDP